MASPAVQAKQVSLLVVEDEPMLLAILREYFERQGFAVFGARGVDKALDVLKKGKVDAVLSDVCLGDLRDGGLSVAAVASAAGIPVLLITAFPDDTLENDPRLKRVSGLVHKPVSCRTLHDMLKSMMSVNEPRLSEVQELIREYAPWLISEPVRKVD